MFPQPGAITAALDSVQTNVSVYHNAVVVSATVDYASFRRSAETDCHIVQQAKMLTAPTAGWELKRRCLTDGL